MKTSDGNYLGTVCYDPTPRSNDAARQFCASNKMKLLLIDSDEVRTSITEISKKDFPPGWVLWIEGKNSTDCSVFQRTSGSGTFFESFFPCSNTFYTYCFYGKLKTFIK